MRAVVMVLRGRFRQYWKSWLVLSVLVAVAGGFVLAAASAGRRTAAAFPDFAARHGYDIIVYSGQPLPQLARLPHVTSVTPVLAPFTGGPACASCRKPIDASNFLINEVPPRRAAADGGAPVRADARPVGPGRGAGLVHAGQGQRRARRLGDPSAAGSALAQLREPRTTPVMRPRAAGGGHRRGRERVPGRDRPHYDLYATTAFAAAVNHRAALLSPYYVRLSARGGRPAGLRQPAPLAGRVGTDDLDADAAAVQARSGRRSSAGRCWLAWPRWPGWRSSGRRWPGRRPPSEPTMRPCRRSACGPANSCWSPCSARCCVGVAGAAGAVLLAVLLSPLTPVGEARLASAAPGRMSFDPVILLLGALAVTGRRDRALSAWPAVRHARLLRRRREPRDGAGGRRRAGPRPWPARRPAR